MHDKIDKIRAKRIYGTLMKFARGNLNSRIHRSDMNDDVEILISIINNALEKASTLFYHQGFVNQHETYNYRVKSFFLLDSDDSIVAFNSGVKKLLFFEDNELKAKSFYSLLGNKSKSDWKRLKSRLEQKSRTPHNTFIVLSLKTKYDSMITMNCLVDKVFNKIYSSGEIMVAFVDIEKDSEKRKRELYIKVTTGQNRDRSNKHGLEKKHKKHLINLKYEDIIKIRKVYKYIRKNPHEPLPPLKKLAESVGTNEYKLKYGFKQLYGQTIHRFLKSERLSKAKQLIKTSDMPLKTIFKIVGFKGASHFSIAFKKKYGLTPRAMRKQSYL